MLFNAFSYKRLEKVLKSKMRLAPIDVVGCNPQITGWIDPQHDKHMQADKLWVPSPVVLGRASIFTRFELDSYEAEILANPKATEHEASAFFQRFPRFLFLGTGREIRKEVTLFDQNGNHSVA